MKAKLIQILLGAVGSVVGVLIQHFTVGAVDPALTVASGSLTTGALGNIANNVLA